MSQDSYCLESSSTCTEQKCLCTGPLESCTVCKQVYKNGILGSLPSMYLDAALYKESADTGIRIGKPDVCDSIESEDTSSLVLSTSSSMSLIEHKIQEIQDGSTKLFGRRNHPNQNSSQCFKKSTSTWKESADCEFTDTCGLRNAMSDIISDGKSDLKIVEPGDLRTHETNDHCITSDQSSLYIELNHSPTLSHVEQSSSTKKLMKNSKHLSRHLHHDELFLHSSSREISTRDHAGQTDEIIPEIYLEINSIIKPEINLKMDLDEENSHHVFISSEKESLMAKEDDIMNLHRAVLPGLEVIDKAEEDEKISIEIEGEKNDGKTKTENGGDDGKVEKAEAEKTKEEEDQEEIEDLDDFVYIQGNVSLKMKKLQAQHSTDSCLCWDDNLYSQFERQSSWTSYHTHLIDKDRGVPTTVRKK